MWRGPRHRPRSSCDSRHRVVTNTFAGSRVADRTARVAMTVSSSEIEVEAERVVELIHEKEWDGADQGSNAFDCHGADLFGLRFGVGLEPGLVGGKQRLERVDVVDVGRDGDDRQDALPEPLRSRVGSVVADDDTRARASRFAPDDGIEVDEADLAAAHQASAVAVSQASLSGSSDHSANAAA